MICDKTQHMGVRFVRFAVVLVMGLLQLMLMLRRYRWMVVGRGIIGKANQAVVLGRQMHDDAVTGHNGVIEHHQQQQSQQPAAVFGHATSLSDKTSPGQ